MALVLGQTVQGLGTDSRKMSLSAVCLRKGDSSEVGIFVLLFFVLSISPKTDFLFCIICHGIALSYRSFPSNSK